MGCAPDEFLMDGSQARISHLLVAKMFAVCKIFLYHWDEPNGTSLTKLQRKYHGSTAANLFAGSVGNLLLRFSSLAEGRITEMDILYSLQDGICLCNGVFKTAGIRSRMLRQKIKSVLSDFKLRD